MSIFQEISYYQKKLSFTKFHQEVNKTVKWNQQTKTDISNSKFYFKKCKDISMCIDKKL